MDEPWPNDEELEEARRIHGVINDNQLSESETKNHSSGSDFDDEKYRKYKPPPIVIDKENVKIIGADDNKMDASPPDASNLDFTIVTSKKKKKARWRKNKKKSDISISLDQSTENLVRRSIEDLLKSEPNSRSSTPPLPHNGDDELENVGHVEPIEDENIVNEEASTSKMVDDQRSDLKEMIFLQPDWRNAAKDREKKPKEKGKIKNGATKLSEDDDTPVDMNKVQLELNELCGLVEVEDKIPKKAQPGPPTLTDLRNIQEPNKNFLDLLNRNVMEGPPLTAPMAEVPVDHISDSAQALRGLRYMMKTCPDTPLNNMGQHFQDQSGAPLFLQQRYRPPQPPQLPQPSQAYHNGLNGMPLQYWPNLPPQTMFPNQVNLNHGPHHWNQIGPGFNQNQASQTSYNFSIYCDSAGARAPLQARRPPNQFPEYKAPGVPVPTPTPPRDFKKPAVQSPVTPPNSYKSSADFGKNSQIPDLKVEDKNQTEKIITDNNAHGKDSLPIKENLVPSPEEDNIIDLCAEIFQPIENRRLEVLENNQTANPFDIFLLIFVKICTEIFTDIKNSVFYPFAKYLYRVGYKVATKKLLPDDITDFVLKFLLLVLTRYFCIFIIQTIFSIILNFIHIYFFIIIFVATFYSFILNDHILTGSFVLLTVFVIFVSLLY